MNGIVEVTKRQAATDRYGGISSCVGSSVLNVSCQMITSYKQEQHKNPQKGRPDGGIGNAGVDGLEV